MGDRYSLCTMNESFSLGSSWDGLEPVTQPPHPQYLSPAHCYLTLTIPVTVLFLACLRKVAFSAGSMAYLYTWRQTMYTWMMDLLSSIIEPH